MRAIFLSGHLFSLLLSYPEVSKNSTIYRYGKSLCDLTNSNNTARPAIGPTGVVQGDVEVGSCSGQRKGREGWSHGPS